MQKFDLVGRNFSSTGKNDTFEGEKEVVKKKI